MRRLEVSRHVESSADEVADSFWDIAGWQRVWNPIQEVTVTYCDGRSQEFLMAVVRDGRRETVRTIRFRAPGRIEFFTPECPPAMAMHRGSWSFRSEGDGCRVTAVREYALHGDGVLEGHGEALDEGLPYHDRFTRRVGAILDCFAQHASSSAGIRSAGSGLRPGVPAGGSL